MKLLHSGSSHGKRIVLSLNTSELYSGMRSFLFLYHNIECKTHRSLHFLHLLIHYLPSEYFGLYSTDSSKQKVMVKDYLSKEMA